MVDGLFVASTVASAMMNGVCCLWQSHEEDEQRAAIRRDIREECERQRQIDMKIWEQRLARHFETAQSEDSSVQEERDWRGHVTTNDARDEAADWHHQVSRRKQLLAEKCRASSRRDEDSVSTASSTSSSRVRFVMKDSYQLSTKHRGSRRAHRRARGTVAAPTPSPQEQRNMLRSGSLLDSDDEAENEGDSSFVDVALQ